MMGLIISKDVTGTATMDGLTVDSNSTIGQTIHHTSGGSD